MTPARSSALPLPSAMFAPTPGTPGVPQPVRVVGIADLAVSDAAQERIVTYALGSCLGVAIHDPVAGVGGMLHAMLPESALDPQKGCERPAMFVDTGVPLLFKEAYRLGAVKQRLVVKVAGGASAGPEDTDHFQIGRRNMVMLRKLLWKNGVLIHAADVGGQNQPRTMSLAVSTGEVRVRTHDQEGTL